MARRSYDNIILMQKNSYLGKFIVIEGLDGSGQSTQAGLLRNFLTEKGYGVVLTKEPTQDSQAGLKIRQILDKKIAGLAPQRLQELFAEDRKEHLKKVIIPALRQGKVVVSDRYFFSSFAYGAGSGAELEELIKLNEGCLMPDLTIILKVNPEVCMERIDQRGEPKTLFEEIEKLKKVWQVYQRLPERFENVYIIDGQKRIERVFQKVKNLIHLKLNL